MMVSLILSETVDSFLGYALTIVTILVIYYVIKFFFVKPNLPEEEVKKGGDGKELVKRLQKKADKSKSEKELKRRQKEMKHPKAYLLRAVENCEKLASALKKKDKKEAYGEADDDLDDLKHHLKHTAHYLKKMRRHEEGDFLGFIDNIYRGSGVALDKALKIELPKPDDKEWDSKVKRIILQVEKIRNICYALVQALDKYQKKAEMEHLEVSNEVEEEVKESQKREAVQKREEKLNRGKLSRGKLDKSQSKKGWKPIAQVRKK